MKRITILPLVALFLSAGVANSQAPVTGAVVSNLEALVTGNKAVIEKQQKTLEVLDKLDQEAQQLKIFARRS